MNKKDSLTNQFLIAMPSLKDSTFRKSVVYLFEHGSSGAMGMVVNKPMDLNLGSVLKHLNITVNNEDVIKLPILMGGPVSQEHGFIVYKDPEEQQQLEISASKEILEEIANGEGPSDFLVTLGYAGWSAGQLEEEIIHNDWLVAPADPKLLFTTPANNRWHKAAELIGVDIDNISSLTGHG